MKRFIPLMTSMFLFILAAYSQAPQSFNYQAIVRDTNSNPIEDKEVSFLINIKQNSPSGINVYSESHSTTSNAHGLVSLEIGKGDPLTGDFSAIEWGTNDFYLEINTDITGGTSYQFLGTSKLLSVPYALYAESDGDWIVDGNNIYSSVNGNVGIGTSTPAEALDIGNGRIGGVGTPDSDDDAVNKKYVDDSLQVIRSHIDTNIAIVHQRIDSLDNDFIFLVPCGNRFNKNDSTIENGYIGTNCAILTGGNYDNFEVSHFIKLDPSSNYTIHTLRSYTMFDENKNCLRFQNYSSSQQNITISTTEEEHWIRFTYLDSNRDNEKVEPGILYTGYDDFQLCPSTETGNGTPIDLFEEFNENRICVNLMVDSIFLINNPPYPIELYIKQLSYYQYPFSTIVDFKGEGKTYNSRKFHFTEHSTGTYTFIKSIYDLTNTFAEIIMEDTTFVVVYNRTITTSKTLLLIGDCLTDNKAWIYELDSLCIDYCGSDKIDFIGIQGISPYNHEGYSGSTTKKFVTYPDLGPPDSPKINPFYNAGNFDVNYYLSSNGFVEPDGVFIYLGTNSTYFGNEQDWTEAVEYIHNNSGYFLKIMVDSILNSWSSEVFIGIPQFWGSQVGGNYEIKRLGVSALAYDVINTFKDYNSRVTLVPMHCTFDSENNFRKADVAVNPRVSAFVEPYSTDRVHPINYLQISDILFTSMAYKLW